MEKRLNAFFGGTVQGVGFRYTVRHLAGRFPVTGYVKNLPDGRVELQAEGEEEILKAFLRGIQSSPLGQYIRDTRVEWMAPENKFNGFQIAF